MTRSRPSLFLLLLNLALSGIFWWQLPPEIPLFYSAPYGPSQLAAKIWFLLLPGFSLACFLLVPLLTQFRVKSAIYSALLSWFEALCLFLFTLAIIHVLLMAL